MVTDGDTIDKVFAVYDELVDDANGEEQIENTENATGVGYIVDKDVHKLREKE